ncbi:SCARECROW-like 1 [Wolffia australiana]
MLNYGTESYRSDYQQYLSRRYTGVSSEDILSTDTPSSSSTSGPWSNSQSSASHLNLAQQNSTEDQSSGTAFDYNEEGIRSKLRALERELLDDLEYEEGLAIDEDWVEPMKSLLLSSSPNESSSGSNNKEPRTAQQLLFDCAAAVSDGNQLEAEVLIGELRQIVSIQGDPPQRLAAYLVEGLAARMAFSGKGIYKALRCKEPPTLDRLSAMQVLFEVCPCFKFGFMAANGVILEAVKNHDRVHIIDFDVNQGSQYFTLLQALATWPIKPRLRITGVDDTESVQRPIGGLTVIGQRLEKLAEQLGISFDFRALGVKVGSVNPSMLNCRPGEALVVNFAFQLHHMPDESVSTVNQRDRLLRMVKGLRPKLVTVVEQDVNTNTAPFLQRFVEVYDYYSAIFKSLDATLPRESPDRMNVERQCLARDIVNIVACEGIDRIERYEVAGKWKARMTMAGFVSCPISSEVKGGIEKLLASYCDRYTAEEMGGALFFGWENKSLVVASAWK